MKIEIIDVMTTMSQSYLQRRESIRERFFFVSLSQNSVILPIVNRVDMASSSNSAPFSLLLHIYVLMQPVAMKDGTI